MRNRYQSHKRTSLPPQMTEHQIKQCAAWQSAISFGHFMNGITQDGNGHPEKHKGVNLTQAMDDELRKVHGKLFANNKEYETPATSVFDEHFDVEHAIEENIQKDLARIARWHEFAKVGDKYALRIDAKTKVGTGFILKDGAIQEYQTNTMTVALKKTNNKYGLELTTAYPNIKDRNSKPTNNPLTAIVKQTDAYNTMSNDPKTRTKAAILLAMSGPSKNKLDVKYNELGGQESVSISQDMEDGRTCKFHIDCQDLNKCHFHIEDDCGAPITLRNTGIYKNRPANPDATHMTYRKALSHNYLDMRKACPDGCRLADRLQTYLFPEEMQPINRAFREKMEQIAAKKEAKVNGTKPIPKPELEPIESPKTTLEDDIDFTG